MNQNTISRRQFLGGLAMGTGVVFLAACAPAAAPAGGGAAPAEGAAAAPAGGGATLTWWDYMGEAGSANGEAVMDQVAKYNAAQSAVTVERTFVPFGDLKQKLLQGAAAGQLPDLVIIDNPDHSSFASLGVLADITDPITAWGKSSDYFPGPWDSTVYQGKNYGIPDNSNCLVQWQNKAFTEPAGITAPTNWDELRAAAAALTEGERFGIALSGVKTEEGTFQWLPFLWMTGEELATLDSDGGREAMQLALAFAFNELNLYRVCLTVFSYNDQAITLYERLGFVREGAYRQHLERDGRRYDMYLYGLLRPEWEKSKDSST